MTTGRTKLAGILGWPVAHSRSPALHGFWLRSYGIDGAYVPLPVRPDDLADALSALPKLGFVGANVTIPHKERALALVDALDKTAEVVGAVNTLVVRDDRTILGSNSDVDGFRDHLAASVPGGLAPGPAIVLGAGGAARAVVAALAMLGVREIVLVNRTSERAAKLAHDLAPLGQHFRLVDWTRRATALEGASLLVNTTSLGMAGHGELVLALDGLPTSAVVADIVYVPLETRLLADARRRGHRVVDGLGMLLHQARAGFKAWFGVEPTVSEALRAHVSGDLAGG